MKPEMGDEARDVVTGFSGIVTGHCEYISGCNQTLLTPKIGSDGKFESARWFDDQRIEVTNRKLITLDNTETPGPDMPAPIR